MKFLQDQIDLRSFKTRWFAVEPNIDEALQLNRQDLWIPTSLFGQAVVGDDVGSLLGLIEVREANRRHRRYVEALGGFDASVPGDDVAIVIDQDRVVEAKSENGFSNLADLAFGMSPSIAISRSKRVDRRLFNLQIAHLCPRLVKAEEGA